MAVINDLKRLVSASRLFVSEEAAKVNAERVYSPSSSSFAGGEEKDGRKGKRERGRWKRGKGKEVEAKMGQGGTLDPLADGVLGMSLRLCV